MELEKNPKTRPMAKRLLKLEDKVKGKAFPSMVRVKEISNYACGPATLEMLLSFVGIKATQIALIRSIRAQKWIKRYGVNIKAMAKAATIAGKKKASFWRKQKASVMDLESVIKKYNYPVGVEWQGDFYEREDEDKGHYGVVTKIEKSRGNMRIADPYFNSYFRYEDLDRKYRINEFVKKWWDTNEVVVAGSPRTRTIKDIRMMFVITPKGETWPKNLGMKK